MHYDKNSWATPQRIIDVVKRYHDFSLDVCASPSNAKAERFYTVEDNCLVKDWDDKNWCNPPYGRIPGIGVFVDKAIYEYKNFDRTTLLLLPSRTGTKWFQRVQSKPNYFIWFFGKRIKFEDPSADKRMSPMEDSLMLAIGHTSMFVDMCQEIEEVL